MDGYIQMDIWMKEERKMETTRVKVASSTYGITFCMSLPTCIDVLKDRLYYEYY